jgi:hypothetical protein
MLQCHVRCEGLEIHTVNSKISTIVLAICFVQQRATVSPGYKKQADQAAVDEDAHQLYSEVHLERSESRVAFMHMLSSR